jgi:hypothetical protein
MNSFDGANDIHTGDVDKDGDLDLIAAAYFDDKISWFENDGNQNFTEHVIREYFDGSHFCIFSDINNDGSYDVLGLAWEGDEITWWEQTTSTSTSVSSSSPSTSSVGFNIEILMVSCLTVILIKKFLRNKKKKSSLR